MDGIQQESSGENETPNSDSATEEEATEGFAIEGEDEADGLDEQNDQDQEADAEQEEANPDDAEAENDEVVFDPKQQAKVNSIINSKVAKTHAEKQRADALEKELAELKAGLPKQEAPQVPPVPNPDDYLGDPEGLTKAIEERDGLIAKKAEFDAQNRLIDQAKQAQAHREEAERVEKVKETISSYTKVAKEFGINEEQMAIEANSVSTVINSPELDDYVSSDPQGPLIVNHLANNLDELDKLAAMTPVRAAAYIEKNIRPNLSSAKKKTETPSPPKHVEGKGSANTEDPLLKGATFS